MSRTLRRAWLTATAAFALVAGVALMALLSMADTASAQNCLNRTVSIADLAAELNRCNPAKLPKLCSVNPPVTAQFIHRQVAAYDGADIPRWLERGPAAKSYDPAQQEKLVAKTEALANANRPRLGGRTDLFDIQFFRKAYGAPGEYQIGANIMYAQCPPIVLRDSCPRKTVLYINLMFELNNVYRCKKPVFCSGTTPIGLMYGRMAGHADPSLWLANSFDPNRSYDEARQDSIIARATNFANANRPDGFVAYTTPYFIYDIDFFDVIVGPVARYIGANITYARCHNFYVSPD